jgi:hypothetical protein
LNDRTKKEKGLFMSTIAEELQPLWDYNKALFGIERKIQYQRAGSHFIARYQGERTYVFGSTKGEAASRLRTWAGKP